MLNTNSNGTEWLNATENQKAEFCANQVKELALNNPKLTPEILSDMFDAFYSVGPVVFNYTVDVIISGLRK